MPPPKIRPTIAADFFLSTNSPTRLNNTPSGVPKTTANPPRVAMGDPQPGRNKNIDPSITAANIEKSRPNQPNRRSVPAGGTALTCSILSPGVFTWYFVLRELRPP